MRGAVVAPGVLGHVPPLHPGEEKPKGAVPLPVVLHLVACPLYGLHQVRPGPGFFPGEEKGGLDPVPGEEGEEGLRPFRGAVVKGEGHLGLPPASVGVGP